MRCADSRPDPGLAFFARPRGVGEPLAPGAGEELGAREAGNFHGEEVVAGGDARAAVAHHFARCVAAENLLERGAQLLGPLELAVRAHVVHVEAVERAGNAPGDRIYRLRVPGVPR